MADDCPCCSRNDDETESVHIDFDFNECENVMESIGIETGARNMNGCVPKFIELRTVNPDGTIDVRQYQHVPSMDAVISPTE
jgi:hypothetical protein